MDTARSQQKQVATAIHLLAMILLCLAVVGAMNAASHRARVQDENLAVMAIASRYLTASEREDSYNPDPISMGAFPDSSTSYRQRIGDTGFLGSEQDAAEAVLEIIRREGLYGNAD